jgi:hypothetical protein
MTTAALITTPNIDNPDDFYAELIAMHAGRSPEGKRGDQRPVDPAALQSHRRSPGASRSLRSRG